MKKLPEIANNLRADIIKMLYASGSGHPGPSLSCIDILTTLYFGGFVSFDEKNPKWDKRDYFVLSKGHAAPALYAVLAEAGFFEKDNLFELRQVNALLQGHPTNHIPGVEVCSGSLGQGLSVAKGIAMGLKIDNKPNKVFSLHGDGELQEGQIWEAVMSSAQEKLGNLVAIVDKNGLQIDGATDEVCGLGDVAKKFSACGWEVLECMGHDFDQIEDTLKKAIEVRDKPVAIIAHTTKGKGVSYMENQVGWHGKAPNEEEFAQAMKELEAV